MSTIKILDIEVDEATQTARIKMTPESEAYIHDMFPDLPMNEAVQAYWDLASKHLETNADLKV